MHRALLTVGCALLVVLTGCGGLLGGNSPNTSERPTPAAVPTDQPFADPPSGLTVDRITDPQALAAAHTDALDESSFTVRTQARWQSVNGSKTLTQTEQYHVAANHRQWTSTTASRTNVRNGPSRTIDSWYNGTHSVYRLRHNDTTIGFDGPVRDPSASPPTERRTLSLAYASATNATIATTGGRIQIRTTRPPASTKFTALPVENVSDWTFTATLTDDGRLIEYQVTYTATVPVLNDIKVIGETIVSFAVPAEMDVDRPNWVAQAQNTTTTGYE